MLKRSATTITLYHISGSVRCGGCGATVHAVSDRRPMSLEERDTPPREILALADSCPCRFYLRRAINTDYPTKPTFKENRPDGAAHGR
ncbi:hypothetical protein EVAR_14718_1 [Eumeta japonica]|uniref:Uncharacterized protein n=1 Tax=Eumeta variegata TaxID=151549 RepID=A0A4C1TXG8_EUMVA|nr:hypothetical protein EVAR_14718_1 [Eumeta japonica]